MNNQLVARALLERFGCRVDMAADGVEALRMLESFEYDLIFMDCLMPEMDGYTAAREIRRRESGGARIPIVAFTANVSVGEREKCISAGMDDYISKPVSIDSLRGAVERWRRSAQPALLPIIKIEPALARIGGDRDLFILLASSFVARQSDLMARIRQSIRASDTQKAAMAAHTIKGCAAMLEATAFTSVAAKMEKSANAGNAAHLPALYAELEGEMARLLPELERQLRKVAGAGS